ncbi:MAG: Hsp20/alpha crystallin family protein [Chloroflexota bacterium]
MNARWDPFRDAVSLREAMDRLLEQSFISPRTGSRAGVHVSALPIDLWETADSLVARVALPGVTPDGDDVDISIDGNVLTIRATLPEAATDAEHQARSQTDGEAATGSSGSGSSASGSSETPQREGAQTSQSSPRVRWITRELTRGEVGRSIELPVAVDADGATARFSAGLLVLTIPKARATRPRRITVTPG